MRPTSVWWCIPCQFHSANHHTHIPTFQQYSQHKFIMCLYDYVLRCSRLVADNMPSRRRKERSINWHAIVSRLLFRWWARRFANNKIKWITCNDEAAKLISANEYIKCTPRYFRARAFYVSENILRWLCVVIGIRLVWRTSQASRAILIKQNIKCWHLHKIWLTPVRCIGRIAWNVKTRKRNLPKQTNQEKEFNLRWKSWPLQQY